MKSQIACHTHALCHFGRFPSFVNGNSCTSVGRHIIFDGFSLPPLDTDWRIRVVIEGDRALKPAIASLIQEVGPVSILYADVQNTVVGSAGQVILELPEDEDLRKAVFGYLRAQGHYFEVKGGHVYSD